MPDVDPFWLSNALGLIRLAADVENTKEDT